MAELNISDPRFVQQRIFQAAIEYTRLHKAFFGSYKFHVKKYHCTMNQGYNVNSPFQKLLLVDEKAFQWHHQSTERNSYGFCKKT